MIDTTMENRRALLVGATGLVGGHVLHYLLDDAAFDKVIVLGRKPLPSISAKLEQHTVNFEHLEQFSSLIMANDVFCCLGTTIKKAGSQAAFERVDFRYPYEVARLAAANGASQYLIVTSLGASVTASLFYSQVKGKVEEAVKALPFPAIHIFRPSMLLGKREEVRWQDLLVPPLMKLVTPLMIGKWKKYRAIEAEVVARAMVMTAKKAIHGKHVYESDEIQAIISG
jgi:uncharacterized protein YbjT (DUF2867 family)